MKKVPLYFPPINKLGNSAFRKVCLNAGADIVFTEMVRVEKLLEGEEHQFEKLEIPEDQRNKTVVQIICEDIKNISKGVDIVMKENPDVFEINYNMGCPQSTLCKAENGGGIVGNPDKVEAVAKELKRACDKYNIEASIKIRLGLTRDAITIYKNVRRIKGVGIKKVYIHGRCLKDGYSRPATYGEIAKVKQMFPDMVIVGNGDVRDTQSLQKLVLQTECDGVLVGRAALENPYIFKELKSGKVLPNLEGVDFDSRKEQIREFLKYAKEYGVDMSKVRANLAYMTKGVIKSADFRRAVNDAKSIDEVMCILD